MTVVQFGVPRAALVSEAMRRLPAEFVDTTAWSLATIERILDALDTCVTEGLPYRMRAVMRAVAHAPRLDELHALTDAACDAVLASRLHRKDAAARQQVDDARCVIKQALRELEFEQPPPAASGGEAVTLALLRSAALRDPTVLERAENTAALASRIAGELKLPEEVVRATVLAARVHDLFGDERSDPRSHCELGEQFLAQTPGLEGLAPIVRSHHERIDGRGYPDGLAGDLIPIEARIVAVADAFIARVSRATTNQRALRQTAEQLLAHAGTLYDCDVVAATLRVVGFRVRRMSA